MTTLRFADPVLISLAVATWIYAAWQVRTLPYAPDAVDLCRRGQRSATLVVLGLWLSFAWLCVDVAATHAIVWSSLPLLAACALTMVTTVPRLRAMRSAAQAFRGVRAVAPALRRDGAHPLLVGPVQITAYAVSATLVEFALDKVGLATMAVPALAVLAVGLSGWQLVRRHRRLAGAVIVPGGRRRMVPGQGVIGALGLSAVTLALVALVATAPPAAAENVHLDQGGTASSTVDE